ncbi:hypothetical protein NQZ68_026989 [Dissostichus eleginoides]|nr:hypothetical protein NQZ68_026989 [Dissostichus eleginoides]
MAEAGRASESDTQRETKQLADSQAENNLDSERLSVLRLKQDKALTHFGPEDCVPLCRNYNGDLCFCAASSISCIHHIHGDVSVYYITLLGTCSGNIAVFGNVVYSGLLNDHLWHLGVPLFTRLVGKSHVRRNKRCVISGHKNEDQTPGSCGAKDCCPHVNILGVQSWTAEYPQSSQAGAAPVVVKGVTSCWDSGVWPCVAHQVRPAVLSARHAASFTPPTLRP